MTDDSPTTDREATGVATALTTVLPSIQQEALPLYYTNAAEDVPRPDPRSLLVVDDYLAVPSPEDAHEAEVAVPGEPTPYFLDGEPRSMTSRTVAVAKALSPISGITSRTRSVSSSTPSASARSFLTLPRVPQGIDSSQSR